MPAYHARVPSAAMYHQRAPAPGANVSALSGGRHRPSRRRAIAPLGERAAWRRRRRREPRAVGAERPATSREHCRREMARINIVEANNRSNPSDAARIAPAAVRALSATLAACGMLPPGGDRGE